MQDLLQALTSTEAITGLLALVTMEVMLGIDNVIFVSIVLGKLNNEKDRKKASRTWMFVGIASRVFLLFTLAKLIALTGNLFHINGHPITLKDIITIGGGLFLLINTTLEIHNKLEGEDPNEKAKSKTGSTFKAVMGQILLVDLVFSFDSIITAFGLVDEQKIGNSNATFLIRSIAVFIAMFVMFKFAPRISNFIHKHPTFKMLAMSFLLLIGVMLIAEGIGFHIPHGYIYFAMAFSFGVEILNMQLRKKVKPIELREPHLTENDKKDSFI